jgi:hypothetical protein
MVGLVLCVKSLSDSKKNNIFCLFFLESNLKLSLNETMLKGFGVSTYSSTSICNSIQTNQIRSSRLKQNKAPRIIHKLKVIINFLTPDKPRLR